MGAESRSPAGSPSHSLAAYQFLKSVSLHFQLTTWAQASLSIGGKEGRDGNKGVLPLRSVYLGWLFLTWTFPIVVASGGTRKDRLFLSASPPEARNSRALLLQRRGR